jgi:hypothetical protein
MFLQASRAQAAVQQRVIACDFASGLPRQMRADCDSSYAFVS